MTKLVIRHALSEANNYESINSPAYGSAQAALMELGREHAVATGVQLRERYGDDITEQKVAVSAMRRTQETAQLMGFTAATIYTELDELKWGLLPPELRSPLDRGVPISAIQHAETLLKNPPEELVWVTHGLVIAGLCRALGVSHDDWRAIPRFCEIRELPID